MKIFNKGSSVKYQRVFSAKNLQQVKHQDFHFPKWKSNPAKTPVLPPRLVLSLLHYRKSTLPEFPVLNKVPLKDLSLQTTVAQLHCFAVIHILVTITSQIKFRHLLENVFHLLPITAVSFVLHYIMLSLATWSYWTSSLNPSVPPHPTGLLITGFSPFPLISDSIMHSTKP